MPDGGCHRPGRDTDDAAYLPTAAVVVEIVSPGDETWTKLPFYARHGDEELLIADPDARSASPLARAADGDRYDEAVASSLLGLATESLRAEIDWR